MTCCENQLLQRFFQWSHQKDENCFLSDHKCKDRLKWTRKRILSKEGERERLKVKKKKKLYKMYNTMEIGNNGTQGLNNSEYYKHGINKVKKDN